MQENHSFSSLKFNTGQEFKDDIKKDLLLKKTKRDRIKINDLIDFKDALKREGYKINDFNENKFKEEFANAFAVDKALVETLYEDLNNPNITYKVYDINDLIDYMKKIMLFEDEYNKLYEKIKNIERINIHRVEYDRKLSVQDDVTHILKVIENTKKNISKPISKDDKEKLEKLEEEISREYLYAKDIELLKKMLIKSQNVKETYDIESKIKMISIDVPKDIKCDYIFAKKGSVEYHEYLSSNIPRLQRLIKNIHKYIKTHEEEKAIFKINQSEALQDSINVAIAIYNNKEFRAISGSNDIKGYCNVTPAKKAVFKSIKVNKLGNLGIGYNRVNDSEKKILEEIHRKIELKVLENQGELTLYTKFEPCPSCYYVINQFCEKYPKIKVQVKYNKKYGE